MNSDPSLRSTVTGVILAGGRGLRVGGADKGLLSVRGCTLVEHQIAALSPQVASVLISANRNLGRYRGFGAPVLVDDSPDYPGPLAGMLAAARAATTGWIACLPCDTLGVPDDAVGRLLRAAQAAGAPAAYAVGADGPQYVLCALRTSLAAALAQALARNRRAVREFMRDCGAVEAAFGDCALVNLNTPEALAC